MDNEEPDKTQEIPAGEPAKPSFRQRAHDLRQRAHGRWSTMSDRTRLIALIATGLVIFVVGFGSGLAVDGGHGRGHGYGHRGGGWCDNEQSYRHHHHRWDCPPTTAPTTTAPSTTTPTTTTTSAPTTTPTPAP